MEELLNFGVNCLRAVLGVVFFVTPGMAVWLLVTGIVVGIRRFRRSHLYLLVRNRTREAPSLSS